MWFRCVCFACLSSVAVTIRHTTYVDATVRESGQVWVSGIQAMRDEAALQVQTSGTVLSEQDALAIENVSKVNLSGPSEKLFSRVTADKCFTPLQKYGAVSPESLGVPIAAGAQGQVWCVTAPQSKVKCQGPCIPTSQRNPACLVLRRQLLNRRSLDGLQRQSLRVADIQIQMAEEGVAPDVRETWQCDSPDPGNQDQPSEVWLAMEPALGKTLKQIATEKGLVSFDEAKRASVVVDKETLHKALENECSAIMQAVKTFHHPSDDTYILHHDLHWGNLLVHFDQTTGYHATLIDFDSSGMINMEMTRLQARRDLKFIVMGLCMEEASMYFDTFETAS